MDDQASRPNPNFFKRERDGSVRIRIRFTAEEAELMEAAAGETPLLLYIHRVLGERARYHIAQAKKNRHTATINQDHQGGEKI